LKGKLITEYRQHHPIIDYSEILRKIETEKAHKAEKSSDVFLDRYYRLNDGSSRLDDVVKPYHTDSRVMSPYELDLNFKLDNEFKELDAFDLKDSKSDSVDLDVPLYKPEIEMNKDVDDFST
jgi:hypothetical protein